MKDNQPELKETIVEVFRSPASAWERRMKEREEQVAEAWDKGHGRVEYRRLVSSSALNDYLDWPGIGQVFQIERRRIVKGRETREVAYGITSPDTIGASPDTIGASLGQDEAGAAELLRLVRCHWGIENCLLG